MTEVESNRRVPALKVKQWLRGWEKIQFDDASYRARPAPFFLVLSMPARELKSLSGIHRREAKNAQPRVDDLRIQRQHDPERSEEIRRFVEFGYPWSTLGSVQRRSREYNDLRKPGWLPTAIVLNILSQTDERGGQVVNRDDIVTVEESEGNCSLRLPYSEWSESWRPAGLPPLEIIDGQHRLWAFEDAPQLGDFELPVVAFMGLDLSWQAYLFWTINIKPKRINASLAFDLYPLLRSEDWLDREEGHAIYRETRAQELTEILWSHPSSPWHDKINMLGERGNPWVSQSAWIKSLTATFVRSWDGKRGNTGGLFGGRTRAEGAEVLGWSRAQQGAFLILCWHMFHQRVREVSADWAQDLRSIGLRTSENSLFFASEGNERLDAAFYGPYSLICSDQGVRGVLSVFNDLLYLDAPKLKLNLWLPDERSPEDIGAAVDSALQGVKNQSFVDHISRLSSSLAEFDWRSSATPDLHEDARRAKLVFRGSGGYKELRDQLLRHLSVKDESFSKTVSQLLGSR